MSGELQRREGTAINWRRLIGYLIYVAALGFIVIMVEEMGRYYQEIFRRTFNVPYLWILFTMIGFPSLIGIGLALPQFIKTAHQSGKWKVDWIRLIVLGLPGLLFVLAYIACMLFPQLTLLVTAVSNTVGYHQALAKVAGILLGFVLLNSLYKQP
jgi:hypothetical protein